MDVVHVFNDHTHTVTAYSDRPSDWTDWAIWGCEVHRASV